MSKTIWQKEVEFRANQSVASKLRDVLGTEYKVEFDSCESGLTRFYYHGVLYKQVPNVEMVKGLDVAAYRAPQELMYAIHFGTTVPTYY